MLYALFTWNDYAGKVGLFDLQQAWRMTSYDIHEIFKFLDISGGMVAFERVEIYEIMMIPPYASRRYMWPDVARIKQQYVRILKDIHGRVRFVGPETEYSPYLVMGPTLLTDLSSAYISRSTRLLLSEDEDGEDDDY
jgi:hypothetical protein